MMFLGLCSCPHPQPVRHTSPLTFLNLSWEPFSLGVVDLLLQEEAGEGEDHSHSRRIHTLPLGSRKRAMLSTSDILGRNQIRHMPAP